MVREVSLHACACVCERPHHLEGGSMTMTFPLAAMASSVWTRRAAEKLKCGVRWALKRKGFGVHG
jgi:hypothetical protein